MNEHEKLIEEAAVTLGTYTVEIRWEDDWWIEIGTRADQGEAVDR